MADVYAIWRRKNSMDSLGAVAIAIWCFSASPSLGGRNILCEFGMQAVGPLSGVKSSNIQTVYPVKDPSGKGKDIAQ